MIKMSEHNFPKYRPTISAELAIERVKIIIKELLPLMFKDKAMEGDNQGLEFLREKISGLKNHKRKTKAYYQELSVLLSEIIYIYKNAYENRDSSLRIYASDRYNEENEEDLFKSFKSVYLKEKP